MPLLPSEKVNTRTITWSEIVAQAEASDALEGGAVLPFQIRAPQVRYEWSNGEVFYLPENVYDV